MERTKAEIGYRYSTYKIYCLRDIVDFALQVFGIFHCVIICKVQSHYYLLAFHKKRLNESAVFNALPDFNFYKKQCVSLFTANEFLKKLAEYDNFYLYGYKPDEIDEGIYMTLFPYKFKSLRELPGMREYRDRFEELEAIYV